eukprot:scaffold27543_cov101-Isochrysis_galbana.AAC.2
MGSVDATLALRRARCRVDFAGGTVVLDTRSTRWQAVGWVGKLIFRAYGGQELVYVGWPGGKCQ